MPEFKMNGIIRSAQAADCTPELFSLQFAPTETETITDFETSRLEIAQGETATLDFKQVATGLVMFLLVKHVEGGSDVTRAYGS